MKDKCNWMTYLCRYTRTNVYYFTAQAKNSVKNGNVTALRTVSEVLLSCDPCLCTVCAQRHLMLFIDCT